MPMDAPPLLIRMAFDWPAVAQRVLEVYVTAIEATDGRVIDEEWAEPRPGA